MAHTYNPKISTNGLTMYLDAGNPASYPGSGATWGDMSGGNTNGTLQGSPTFSSLRWEEEQVDPLLEDLFHKFQSTTGHSLQEKSLLISPP